MLTEERKAQSECMCRCYERWRGRDRVCVCMQEREGQSECVCRLCEWKIERDRVVVSVGYVKEGERGTG